MKKTIFFLRVMLYWVIFITITATTVSATAFLGWEPSLLELLPDDYDTVDLGDNPADWTWSTIFPNEIQDIYVAAPIHPIPYRIDGPYQEYNATHGTSDIFLEFFSPGLYTALIDFKEDSVEDHIQFFEVNSYDAKLNKKPNRKSRQENLVQPVAADIIIIENPDSDNDAIRNAAQVIEGEVRVNSVTEAIKAINTAYANNGNKPVSVEFVGHGNSNIMAVGDGDNDPNKGQILEPDKHLTNNSPTVQNFVNSLKGKVSSITLKGCSVAENVDIPGRNHLMESLADGLNTPVYAWDEEIYWTGPSTFFGFTLREGYASLDVHGKLSKVNPIPEPSTLLLFCFGLFCLAGVNKKLRKD